MALPSVTNTEILIKFRNGESFLKELAKEVFQFPQRQTAVSVDQPLNSDVRHNFAYKTAANLPKNQSVRKFGSRLVVRATEPSTGKSSLLRRIYSTKI